jgi:2-polyprenyl-3-methyl-5-hydroxy-6-metoxy-1,4-benzoquinol methylase
MDELETVRRSFRDPAGSVTVSAGRVLRNVNGSGLEDLAAFRESATVRRFTGEGKIVRTTQVEAFPDSTILEHERIPFPSYPYEWAPEMLRVAGLLTLDLAEGLLTEGMGLKDATPFNILWRGPNPVFVDVLSFERRNPADATWLPLAQFDRTFLLPLMANTLFSAPLSRIFLSSREGLEPEEVYRWAGSSMRWNIGFLTEVALPVWLGAKNKDNEGIYRRKLQQNPEKARYILEALFRRKRAQLLRWKPPTTRATAWTGYTTSSTHYSDAASVAKNGFVEEALREFRPKRVLDIGCNTGHFSAIAARSGASVVALDSDPAVVNLTWERAHSGGLDILPLVVNLAHPTPGTGWRNQECPSFLERASGTFDCVMMLAVVHHLLVTERVPLAEIAGLAVQLTTDLLILEFVAPEDLMFERITRGRGDLHRQDSAEAFERACARIFEIVRKAALPGSHRTMYCLRKRRV